MNLSALKRRTRVQIQQLVAEFVSLSNTMLRPPRIAYVAARRILRRDLGEPMFYSSYLNAYSETIPKQRLSEMFQGIIGKKDSSP
jgi:hypothetical protein